MTCAPRPVEPTGSSEVCGGPRRAPNGTELEDALTEAFRADRWVQPRSAAKLALRTISDAGFTIEACT